MQKHTLGTGNKRAVKSTPKTAYTSARQIKLRERRSAVLNYRLQGHSCARIAKHFGCAPSTIHDDILRAMHEMIPVETAQQVLRLELQRLDELQSAVMSRAADGDIEAIETCLRIQNQRCRLMGLYPNERNGGQHVHLNVGDSDGPDAFSAGIQVTFIDSRHPDPDELEAVNGKLLLGPKIDHEGFK
jgi:hypothetical protein